MLTTASFGNFKALGNVSIPLRPITVLIGPNGSGKSSVLDGIHLVTQLVVPTLPRDLRERAGRVFQRALAPERLRTVGADGPMELVVASDAKELGIQWHPPGPQELAWEAEVFYPDRQTSVRLSDVAQRGEVAKLSQSIPASLGAAVRLRLDAAKLRRPSYSEEEVPRLEHDGAALPSVIAHIAATAPEAREAIEAALARVVSGAGRIRAPRSQITHYETMVLPDGETMHSRQVERQVWGNKLELEMKGAGFLPADLLSDGTLLALAVVTLLYGPHRPGLVLLDDLEKGLHPHAQQEMVGVLRGFREQVPDAQFVVTTHSPYLLDRVEDEEVFALCLDDAGHARCRALSKHPDWAAWRGKMRLGEFWSTVGEDWVLASST